MWSWWCHFSETHIRLDVFGYRQGSWCCAGRFWWRRLLVLRFCLQSRGKHWFRVSIRHPYSDTFTSDSGTSVISAIDGVSNNSVAKFPLPPSSPLSTESQITQSQIQSQILTQSQTQCQILTQSQIQTGIQNQIQNQENINFVMLNLHEQVVVDVELEYEIERPSTRDRIATLFHDFLEDLYHLHDSSSSYIIIFRDGNSIGIAIEWTTGKAKVEVFPWRRWLLLDWIWERDSELQVDQADATLFRTCSTTTIFRV